MSTQRVINKYPNRRLYDTEESRYITLSDIRELVLEQVEFVVIDKKDGRDITRCVLLQVISEREQQGNPVLSQHFLSEIIRSGDDGVTKLSAYLEQSLSVFLDDRCGEAPASAATYKNAGRWSPLLGEDCRAARGELFTGAARAGGDDSDAAAQKPLLSECKKAG